MIRTACFRWQSGHDLAVSGPIIEVFVGAGFRSASINADGDMIVPDMFGGDGFDD